MKINKIILLLSVIILVNILDFLQILPTQLHWIEKLITLFLLAYLFYHANITKVFFGQTHNKINIGIIIVSFIMVSNVLIFSLPAKGSKFIELLMRSLQLNLPQIGVFLLFLGGILFLILSIWIADSLKFKKPSFAAAIGESGQPPKKSIKYLTRVLTVFLILLAFYYFIFRLFVEWFGLAVHATFLIVLLLFFLILIFINHKHFKTKMLKQIASAGEEYYEKFVQLFHTKRTALFAISGLLVLHPLVDIANFIIPYLTGLYNEIYLRQLPFQGHKFIATLLSTDIIRYGNTALYIYFFNIVAMIFFLALPFIIWLKVFRKKKVLFPRSLLTILGMAIPVFLLTPIFKLQYLGKIPFISLIGVDIGTREIVPIMPVHLIFLFSLIMGVIVYSLGKKYQKKLSFLVCFSSLVFLAYYVLLFFIDTWTYLAQVFYFMWIRPGLIVVSEIAAILILVFLILSILFYPLAFYIYLSEIRQNLK